MNGATRPARGRARARSAATSRSRPRRTSSTPRTARRPRPPSSRSGSAPASCSTTTARSTAGRSPRRSRSGRRRRRQDRHTPLTVGGGRTLTADHGRLRLARGGGDSTPAIRPATTTPVPPTTARQDPPPARGRPDGHGLRRLTIPNPPADSDSASAATRTAIAPARQRPVRPAAAGMPHSTSSDPRIACPLRSNARSARLSPDDMAPRHDVRPVGRSLSPATTAADGFDNPTISSRP